MDPARLPTPIKSSWGPSTSSRAVENGIRLAYHTVQVENISLFCCSLALTSLDTFELALLRQLSGTWFGPAYFIDHGSS